MASSESPAPLNTSGPSSAPAPTPPEAPPETSPRVARMSLALAAGLLAGLGAWAVGEATLTVFEPELQRVDAMGIISMEPTLKGTIQADTRNAALAFGVLGALLGLLLGLAGGLVRRLTRQGAMAGLVGVVVGGVVGSGMTLALLPIYFGVRDADPLSFDLTVPLMIHVGIWSAVGAAGGMAFGIGVGGRDRVLRAAIGGLVGAALGAVAFELIGAIFFPFAETPKPVSESMMTRLLARLLVAVLAAGFAAAMAFGQPRRKARPAAAGP